METLDRAQDSFRATPSRQSAGIYLSTLIEYQGDDMIGDDTFFDGLLEISNWLTTPNL